MVGVCQARYAACRRAAAARTRSKDAYPGPDKIIFEIVGNGIDAVIGTLGMAFRKYAPDETRARWEINPWIVEAALERLGERRLTLDEQREVFANTRTPHKVNWPEWWEVLE